MLRTDAAPVVSVQVWYHAGSKDEPRDRRGTAHMFEHLMFKGSAHLRPDVHNQSLVALGGYGNAATDEDATHYLDTVPASGMDYAVRLEAERMRNLLFARPAIDSQREVVKDELRQQELSPLAHGLRRCLAVEYLHHPYAWTSAGVGKDLDAISPDDLKKFYDAYYQPGNAMLIVVGKVTTEEVKASAEKWFGAIPKAGEPPRPAAASAEPAQTTRRRAVVEPGQPGQPGLIMIGWHLPPGKDKDIHALQLATLVLGAGDGSRLKLRLKTPDAKTSLPLAREAGMDALVHEDPGIAIAIGAYDDPGRLDALETAMFDEIGKLAANAPTGDELRRAKSQMESGFLFSLETAQGLGDAIGRSWILTGDPTAYAREIDEIEKVSPADLQRVVKQYFTNDHATVVVIPPKGQ